MPTAIDRSLHRLLLEQAQREPGAVSLLAPARHPLTYDGLRTQVGETVKALNEHGIGIDDRVALVLENGPELAACFLAVAAAATCAPLNPAYRDNEFDFAFSDLLPKALIVEQGVDSPAREVAASRGVPVIELVPHAREAAGLFGLVFPDPHRTVPAPVFAEGDAVALILHTSGTTSRPKMVPLTQANLCHSALNIKGTLGLGPGDRCLNVMPLFHVHGLVGALLSSIAAGGSVVCSPGFFAPKFFAWVDEFQPTWYTAVPAMHQAIVSQAVSQATQDREIARRSRLRFVRSSSSALPPRVMTQLEDVFGAPVVEAYGMTEAAHQMASNLLPPGTRKPGSAGVAIGSEVAVMDEQGRVLGPEAEGDVFVRGPNVMLGYASSPSSGDQPVIGEWLRTGDRGWLDAEGYLFLTGRTKEIINRGGEKISPREIDEVLMDHPDVAAALAFACPDARLGEDVAAAVVLNEGASTSERELREFASSRLADFKVPRRILFVNEIPKGPTGKPQRIGLALKLGLADAGPLKQAPSFVAARTATEGLLCDLWSQVLGRVRVGIHDNFFELGGDSVLAAKILSRVREATGRQLSMIGFFEEPTVADIASRLSELVPTDGSPAQEPSIPTEPRSGGLPLSFAQSGLWFSSQLDPHSTAYNVAMAIRVEGSLDVNALTRSLNEIVRRHEILRTSFPSVDGGPVQVVHDAAEPGLKIVDLGGLPAGQRDAALTRLREAESQKPFDLFQRPLLRAVLIRLDADTHVLQLDMHHIVADAWSRRILAGEIVALYRQAMAAVPQPLPQLKCQYADFARWQTESFTQERLETGIAFWRKELANAPVTLRLRENAERPQRAHHTRSHESVVLSRALVESLRTLSQRQGVSLFMTLAAGFQTLLHRLTGEEDIVIGFPIAGRDRGELEPLVGCFINTLILRTDLSGNPTFDVLLGRVRHAALRAYDHQDLPFEKVVEALHPQRGADRMPLFNVMLDFVDKPYVEREEAGVRFVPLDVPERMPNLDLMLYVKRQGDSLQAQLHYRRDVVSAAWAARTLHQLRFLLEEITKSPELPLRSYALDPASHQPEQEPRELEEANAVPALTDAERRRLCVEWNATMRSYPTRRVHELFEVQAARRPDAVAVVDEGTHLTYGELNRRANQLARRLRARIEGRAVGRNTPVGVCLERSPEMIVGWLGILKAGGAYVPLDPADPPARRAFMTTDTGLQVVVTTSQIAGSVASLGIEIVCVDTLADEESAATNERPGEADPAEQGAPDDLAYVMYTSGSTGQPKGVEITHRGIVRLLFGVDYAAFNDGQVWLQLAPPAFDASTLEVWGALLHGARCVLFPDRVPTARQLGAVIRTHGVTALWLTASLFNAVVDEAPETLAPIEQLLVGGEALSVAHVRRALAALPTTRLVNGYGPTETTTFACCYEIPRVLPDGLSSIPIGRPIGNTRVYVLDERLEPVPVGVPGELYIGGDGLARGYRHRPELTRERFVAAPPLGETRLYKTGDRARYQADGTLEFLGRFDHQVKIHGFRIELEEIQTVLEGHAQIQQAAVMAAPDGTPGGQRLVAYVVAVPGKKPSVEELQGFLRQQLPAPMVPSWFEYLPALPLTPNGKLDRQALPVPDFTTRSTKAGFVAPRTELEKTLADIFGEVVQARPIGVDDNFFDLGGHSLLTTRVLARVSRRFGRQIPLRQFYEAPTIAALAAALDPNGTGGSIIPRRDSVAPCRLSFAQKRLWFLDRLRPGSAVYNVPLMVELDGDLDHRALERALSAIVARHESLRTTIREVDGSPVQVVAAAIDLPLATIDLTTETRKGREDALGQILDRGATRPYDLSRDLMLRSTLVRLGESQHALVLTLHHIATDGWSLDILFRELRELYNAYAEERESALVALPIQYADYAEWQRGSLTDEVVTTQLRYWQEQLEGQAVLQMPTDRPRPAVRTERGASERVELSEAVSASVRTLSGPEGVVAVLLAAFGVLLHRYSQQEDVSIGVPVANRSQVETEGLIGFFVNTVVVRMHLDGAPAFREVLTAVKASLLGAQDHQDVPFEQVVEALHPERSASYTPLCQVMFAPQDGVRRRFDLGDVHARVNRLESGTAKFDLTLGLTDEGGQIEGAIEYSTDLYDAETVRRMARHYGRLLEALTAHPDRPISDASMVSHGERRRLCVEWNATTRVYPPGCVHELFEVQAARRPDAVAVVDKGTHLTYEELNRRANQLARRLRVRGVGRNVPVGVCLERSPEMIVGWLGILKAGGAYVPLDPADPPARRAFMTTDTGLQVAVTTSRIAATLASVGMDVVCVDTLADEERDAGEEYPAAASAAEVHPVEEGAADDLAYVMYTSGSTGRPKGVEITHRGIVRLLFGVDYAAFNDGQVWLQLAPPAFDASTLEVWGALLHGAHCVLFPDRVPTARQLGAVIRTHGVTALWLTASLFNAVVDEAPETLAPIEQLLVGGEALSVAHVRRALAALPTTRLVNGYGPTESTTFTCCYEIPRVLPEGLSSIPIGRPIGNTRVYVLDERLEPVPVGVPGELYIGGDGLARGYRYRPELTRERFIAAPALGEARLYKTGDRARYRPDGTLEFLGRFDRQVKIRGFRIEPGEIEAALLQHPAVERCVVSVNHEPGTDNRLAAYVVVRDRISLSADELRAFARSKLPEPMVPAAFVFLDQLPLAQNGKVDREALPVPPASSGAGEYIPPRDALETELTRIWEQLLGTRPIGVKDNFFDRGGHSLAAVRLFARIEKELVVKLLPALIFSAPTIERLAAVLRDGRQEEAGEASLPSILRIQPTGSSPPFFWVHGDSSNSYLSEYLGPDQPLFGLEHQSQDGTPAAFTRVETIAEHYLWQIRAVQPLGPYMLGGYSFGGAIAFEIALRLERQGETVSLLAMLDAPFPGLTALPFKMRARREASATASRRSGTIVSRLRDFVRMATSDRAKYIVVGIADRTSAIIGHDLRKHCKRLLCKAYVKFAWRLPASLRSFHVLEVYRLALPAYSPQAFAGRAIYFKSLDQSSFNQEGWRTLMRDGLEVYEVPGNHLAVIEKKNAAVWAERLKSCISTARQRIIAK